MEQVPDAMDTGSGGWTENGMGERAQDPLAGRTAVFEIGLRQHDVWLYLQLNHVELNGIFQ